MARHETFPLDSETAARADAMRTPLMEAVSEGLPVRIAVEGRDSHLVTERTGTVIAFTGGRGLSSETVIMDTDKGPRSFNVWLIRSVEIVGGAE